MRKKYVSAVLFRKFRSMITNIAAGVDTETDVEELREMIEKAYGYNGLEEEHYQELMSRFRDIE